MGATTLSETATAESTDAPLNTVADTQPARDGFLDALRAIAIVRVVIWHAFGTPVISWVIATMPIMFFVAGSLLLRSLTARPALGVLRSRLRRLLLPFWLFGAIVLSFLSAMHLLDPTSNSRMSPDQLLGWIVPLVNPTASIWEAGWASSPLWYIRAYLWLLLLSPLLVRAWRRLGLALAPLLLIVMMIGELGSRSLSAGPNHPIWIVGDIGIYGFFVVLGFAHHDGAFAKLRDRDLAEWIVVAVAATAVAWRLFPAADGVVNHSYPALLTAGIGWLAVALLARPLLSTVPQLPVLGPVLFWMTRRAMSIYLWHSPAIVASYALVDHLGAAPAPTLILAFVVPILVVAVTTTGWIEDVAGGRPAEIWPTSGESTMTVEDTIGRLVSPRHRSSGRTALLGAAVGLVLLSAIAPVRVDAAPTSTNTGSSTGGVALPPAPSGRPDPQAGATGVVATNSASAEPGGVTTSGATTASLSQLTDEWLSTSGIDGVSLVVSLPDGTSVAGGSGVDASGGSMPSDAITPVTSITKTVTAAVALQLVEEGLLDLDAPMSTIPGAGKVPNNRQITLRQLLNHSSGLAPYQDTPGYDAAAPLDALTAVRAALGTNLQWEPGTRSGYSNSGFLALGLIIESTTGRPYAEVVRERIIEPYKLTNTSFDATPTAGWIGGSAGGLVASLDDLATWGEALYRDGSVVSSASLAAMTSIDEVLVAGLGAFPVCPCESAGDGTLTATSIGHNGGTVTLQYAPASGVVVAAAFSESFWIGDFDQADVYELLALVRNHVSS